MDQSLSTLHTHLNTAWFWLLIGLLHQTRYNSPCFPILPSTYPLLAAAREIVLKSNSDSVITSLLKSLGESPLPTSARANIFSMAECGPRELLFIHQGPFTGLSGAVSILIPRRFHPFLRAPHHLTLFSARVHMTGCHSDLSTSASPTVREPEIMSNVLCSPRAQD